MKKYNGKYKGVTAVGIKSVGNVVCKTGTINAYRLAFLKGRGGSRKEHTWNKDKHHHECCKSKVGWQHKVDCPRLKDNFKMPIKTKKNIQKKFKNFLSKNGLLEKDERGIQFRCDGCNKRCLITSPVKEVKRNKMYEFNIFKEVLIENCKKKLKNNEHYREI